MTKKSDVAQSLKAHDAMVEGKRHDWRRYRNALKDDFWSKVDGGGRTTHDASLRAEDYPLKVQVNHVRRWLESYVDSLFHKRVRSMVRPMATEPAPGLNGDAVAALFDTWVNSTDVEDLAERGFAVGLMYGEAAFKLGSSTPKSGDPVAGIWHDIMPPWECVWDRQARSLRELRYVGHVYWTTREELGRKYPDADVTKLKPSARPDPLTEGAQSRDMSSDKDQAYVRVLEYYDLVGEYELPSDGQDVKSLPGRFCVYVVEGSGGIGEPLHEGPIPYTDVEGEPIAPIVPMVLMYVPEYPLEGIAGVSTVYQLNSEINWSRTFLANAARKDAARKLLTRKDGLDEGAKSALTSGIDGELVDVESDHLDGQMKWLEMPPIAPSLLQYVGFLEQDRESTAGLSPTTRGQPMAYATATEVNRLNEYSETTLGRLRKRMDRVIEALLVLFQRVVAAAMDDAGVAAIPVIVRNDVVMVPREWFDVRWRIDIADSASTPLAEQQKRTEFLQVQPLLMELAQMAVQPGPAGSMAQAQLKYVLDMWDLPPSFDFEALMASATPVPPPMPPEQMAPAAGPMDPGMPMEAAPPPLPEGVPDAAALSPM